MNLERVISLVMEFDGFFLVAWILLLAAAFAMSFREPPLAAPALEPGKPANSRRS